VVGQPTRRLFGTDGVRGRANEYPMTPEMALNIGRATVQIAAAAPGQRPRIVIGQDTRLSGDMLTAALTAGVCSMGGDALLLGPLPTPGIAYLTTHLKADAGIAVSASHNPFPDNGLKIFSGDGFKLPDEAEDRLEELVFSETIDRVRPTGSNLGRVQLVKDAVETYTAFLKVAFPRDLNLDGVRLVVDCAHGAAFRCAPVLLQDLGAKVFLLGASPDGENINRDAGSLCPEKAAAKVLEQGADLGLALDGDADRAIFVDEQGRIVDGDHIMAVCAQDLDRRGRLAKRTVVATVMSNLGLEKALASLGIRLVRTQVGDRYVVETMRAGGYNFGGEQSGHLIFLDHSTTGDGLLSALRVLAVMRREGKSLAELADMIETFPQVLVNVRVGRRADLNEIPSLAHHFRQVEERLGDEGRLLVRYSGTEPLVRVMIEGLNQDEIQTMAEETAALIGKELS
jgi:phosphoglucosamine mutase